VHNYERCLSQGRVCEDFVSLGKNLCLFAGSQQNMKQSQGIAAFFGNDKERESVGFLVDVA